MATVLVVKPKLIVFDLDYTLWPFWVDTHVNPPFRKKKQIALLKPNHALIPNTNISYHTVSNQQSVVIHWASSSGSIVDSTGATVKCYKEVPKVLEKLKQDGYILGVASRTSEIRGAMQLIELFGWAKYFTYKEIYPGKKTTHFANFRKQSGIQYKDMLFFDDENRNIKDLKGEGVTSILVQDGVTEKVVENGLKEYAQCC